MWSFIEIIMIEQILTYDKEILLLINGAHNQVFDMIMLFISSKLGWLPLYIFLLYVIINDYGRKTWFIIIMIAVTVLLSDQISVQLFKNVFQRLRPCHEESLSGILHLVKSCGGKYGFASGHAANSFGLATSLFFIFRINSRYLGWIFLWAFVVSYSRIYVGVHYPLDIITGGMIGITLGYLGSVIYNALPGKLRPVQNNP